MGFRAVKPALTAGLLALAACGGSGESGVERDSGAGSAAQNAPAAVRYDQYGSAADPALTAEARVNPLIDEPGAAAQGEALFAAMNCDGCHGAGAVGFVGPSLVDGRWRYGGDDGALFHSIFYGRSRGMPAYSGILSDATVWQLVTFLRSQPVPAVVPTVAWP
ncbi:MAG: cytochrome c [Woeseiaceae bacterium]|nr:cytochrome c [Woeseiaceae bacterium]